MNDGLVLFVGGLLRAVTVGAVLSIFMLLTVSLTVLPKLSVQLPVADWPVPSELTVLVSPGSIAPVQVHVTTTSVLFQPAGLAGVRLANVITGKSSWRITTSLPVPK